MKNINFNDLTDEQLDRLTNDLKTINNNVMNTNTKEQILKRHVTIDEDDALYYEKAILNAMEDYAEIKMNNQRISHNKTLLMLGAAKQTIDLMRIMLLGAEKQDFIIYPSSDKTPNYLDIIANKIAEFDKITGA